MVKLSKKKLTLINIIILASLTIFSYKYIEIYYQNYFGLLVGLFSIIPTIIYLNKKKFWTNILLYVLSLSTGSLLKNLLIVVDPDITQDSFTLTFFSFSTLYIFSDIFNLTLGNDKSSLIFVSQILTFNSIIMNLNYPLFNSYHIKKYFDFISLFITNLNTFINIIDIKNNNHSIVFNSINLYINLLNTLILNVSTEINNI